jgi:hypothetical protein
MAATITIDVADRPNIYSFLGYTNTGSAINYPSVSLDSTLTSNNGYWIFLKGAQSINITLNGLLPISNITLTLVPGWNLIGTSMAATITIDAADRPNIYSFLGYTNTGSAINYPSVSLDSTLTSNNGYWIFLKGANNINITLNPI